jgi:hypothetical protein
MQKAFLFFLHFLPFLFLQLFSDNSAWLHYAASFA